MTSTPPPDPASDENGEELPSAARRNRGIRFSDPEWEEVRQAAQTAGITPAEFIRERVLALIRNPAASESVSIPTNVLPLIERTFRYTYMLATKMRNDMIAGDKAEELDHLLSEARALQDTLVASPTTPSPPTRE